MDELLARERAAHEYVTSLQSHQEVPFKDTLAAFEQYRQIVQEVVLARFFEAEKLETRLWKQHTDMRKLLSRTLKDLRKQEQKTVETRIATEMYLRFIRHCIRFYRGYIAALAAQFGGIPELETVAQQMKKEGAATDHTMDTALRKAVLSSCYRTLIYLGDLCRYRATDELDKQDFGPAIGYYSLACTIRPDAGWSFHQQAVIALEQKDYLKTIYHFYRSYLVAEPVALAKKHLRLQYEKANTAWENGDLIIKGPAGDPLASEKTLVGWFVRLHSTCNRGEIFRGYEEILRELTIRIQVELRTRAMDSKLRRMAIVNIAAQHDAMENYRESQTAQLEQAFYYSLHINVIFFSTVLELFDRELALIAKRPDLADAELSQKLTPVMLRIMPVLRIYSNWLMLNTHLLQGLATNDFLSSAIAKFWRVYAQVLDTVSAVFPIFDLEDCEQVTYLLEEDAETLGFLPLIDTSHRGPVHRTTHAGQALKPRFSDAGVARLEVNDEMLARVHGILEAGSHVAVEIADTPIFIRGTRFSLSSETETFELPQPPPPKPVEPSKPLSYAAAAAKAQAEARRLAQQKAKATPPAVQDTTNGQGIQLEQMVDNLVDDDDTDHPVTPPASLLVPNTIIEGTDIALGVAVPSFSPKINLGMTLSPSGTIIPATASSKRARERRKEDLSDFNPRPKVQGSAASLWSPSAPTSRPQSTVQSPSFMPRLHQRVNSATSMRSATSPRLGDSWSSLESAPQPKRGSKPSLSNGIAATSALQQSLAVGAERGMISPKQGQRHTIIASSQAHAAAHAGTTTQRHESISDSWTVFN